MAAQQYSLLAFVKPTGEGVSDSWFVSLKAVAKNNEKCGYFISNEYICAEIGRVVGIPIPPSGLVYASEHDVKNWFACLNFNLSGGDTLPIVDTERCVEELEDISTGLLFFDILVANSDRHPKNFSVDFSAKPPRMSVFDHSHALFGNDHPNGIARLASLRDRIAVSDGSVTGGNCHCLLDKINSDVFFEKWYVRIEAIPAHLIEDVCRATVSLDMLTPAEADAAIDFLMYRKSNIREIIKKHRRKFSGIDQTDLYR